jgi:phage baseplate assembly protein V
MNKVPGVVIGLVRSLDDDAGEGRIQVEFPWMDADYRSGWAPIATPLAGGERGLFFMPEIGDEVLVGFEHGEMDHPFVVGFLWNGKDRPPETDPNNRVIRTPGGHELRFEDGDGAKKIVLSTAGGHVITLDDAQATRSVSIATKGKLSLVLDDTVQGGSIKLSGGGRTMTITNGQLAIT